MYDLEAKGKLWGRAESGGPKGGPATGDIFVVALQPSLERRDAACKGAGGFAIAGADDVVAQGSEEGVMAALRVFEEEVRERCGLVLRWRKMELFKWRGDLPPDAPTGLTLAGRMAEGVFRRGFMCWVYLWGRRSLCRRSSRRRLRKSYLRPGPLFHYFNTTSKLLGACSSGQFGNALTTGPACAIPLTPSLLPEPWTPSFT